MHRVKLLPIVLLWPLLTTSEQLRQSLVELVAIALFWPILTPTRRVGVNSIFVAVIDTNELVAIDTAQIYRRTQTLNPPCAHAHRVMTNAVQWEAYSYLMNESTDVLMPRWERKK